VTAPYTEMEEIANAAGSAASTLIGTDPILGSVLVISLAMNGYLFWRLQRCQNRFMELIMKGRLDDWDK